MQGTIPYRRPITLAIVALVVPTLVAAFRRHARERSANGGAARRLAEPSGESPLVSVLFDTVMLSVFVYAAVAALEWRANARLFPRVAALPAIPLVIVAAARDVRAVLARREAPAESDTRTLRLGGVFYAWLCGILLATLLIGQYLALLVFVVLYLRLWGKAGWIPIAVYTVASGAFLYLLFNLVVPVLWYESPYFSLFG